MVKMKAVQSGADALQWHVGDEMGYGAMECICVRAHNGAEPSCFAISWRRSDFGRQNHAHQIIQSRSRLLRRPPRSRSAVQLAILRTGVPAYSARPNAPQLVVTMTLVRDNMEKRCDTGISHRKTHACVDGAPSPSGAGTTGGALGAHVL